MLVPFRVTMEDKNVANTKLPKINASRLQRSVADVEFSGEYTNFDDLCKAVEATTWAKGLGLDAWTLGALMIQHDTIVTMDKPDAMPETQTPPPVKPVVAPATAAAKLVPAGWVQGPSEITTYDEGGRGKKQCPACKKYVGARNSLCACGHEFNKSTKPNVTTAAPTAPVVKPQPKSVGAAVATMPVQQGYVPGRHVSCTVRHRTAVPAPATSPCPHKLMATDIQTVEEWAEKVRIHFLTKTGERQWMMVSALKYYAREYFNVFGPEYAEISKNLDTIYANEDSRSTFED